jgi:hypothetical protein
MNATVETVGLICFEIVQYLTAIRFEPAYARFPPEAISRRTLGGEARRNILSGDHRRSRALIYFDVSRILETWKFLRCVSLTLNLERRERFERAALLIATSPPHDPGELERMKAER